jgi:hypothetical protein
MTMVVAMTLVGIALFSVVAMIWLVKDPEPRVALVWVACICALSGALLAAVASDDDGIRTGSIEGGESGD